jgi:hypothetical protein
MELYISLRCLLAVHEHGEGPVAEGGEFLVLVFVVLDAFKIEEWYLKV